MNFGSLKRTWIVAEIGVNHEGDVKVAEDLIHKAAKTGVDAVKFQTFTVENYISTLQPERRERSGRFALPYEQFKKLAKIAASDGLVFFSTPLHADDVDFLDTVAPIFKISSGDITYLSLISHIAKKGKPIILSTGLATKEEIQAAVDAVLRVRPDARAKGELALLHCVSKYPTPMEQANLANIKWLQQTFGLPVGYSDHTLGTKACELAVAAGAKILEKHFTYRKEDQAFRDHAISANPEDMTQLVAAVRQAEIYLGQAERTRVPADAEALTQMRRALAAAVNIPANTPVKGSWLTYLRPALGLPPEKFDYIVGKLLKRAIAAGELIKEEDLVLS